MPSLPSPETWVRHKVWRWARPRPHQPHREGLQQQSQETVPTTEESLSNLPEKGKQKKPNKKRRGLRRSTLPAPDTATGHRLLSLDHQHCAAVAHPNLGPPSCRASSAQQPGERCMTSGRTSALQSSCSVRAASEALRPSPSSRWILLWLIHADTSLPLLPPAYFS